MPIGSSGAPASPSLRPRSVLARGVAAGALVLALGMGSAAAQLALADDRADPVVARVDGEAIRQSDLEAAVREMPDHIQAMPPETLMPFVLDQLVSQKVVVAAARKAGLDRTPEIRRRIEAAETEALQQAWFTGLLVPLLAEDKVRARYDAEMAKRAPAREAKVEQIRVATETQAREALARIKAGEPFADVARAVSLGPGAAEGGALGTLAEGQEGLPAEFLKAAFALPEGGMTETPVHTQFGWHIIRLSGLRASAPPDYDTTRDEIRNLIAREAVEAELGRLKAAARIETQGQR